MSFHIVVDSPPGRTRPALPRTSSAVRTRRAGTPRRASAAACASKSPCRARTPTAIVTSPGSEGAPTRRACPPRSPSSPRRGLRTPSRRAPGRPSGSSPRRSRGRGSAGSSDLKMPEPTKTASAPRIRQRAASAGVAMPPAAKFGTGSRPFAATQTTSSNGAPSCLAAAIHSSRERSVSAFICARHLAQVLDRVDDVARSRLALRPDHRGAFADAAERLAEVPAAADERDLVVVLVDVVLLVGRRQDLALVDEVDLERLEDPRLGEVPDAALGHDRDGDRLLDLADLRDRATSARRRRRGGCRTGRARAP